MFDFQAGRGTDEGELPLIAGEDIATEDPAQAAAWVRIYSELVGMHEGRPGRGRGTRQPQAEQLLDQLRSRLEEWRQRHLELAGMDFDPYTRLLMIGGRAHHLTRRESQLLDFLLERPGQHFTSELLIREAWQDPRLAPEQVRTYIVRLRRKLREAGAPAQLENRPGVGYSLSLGRAGERGRGRPSS